MARSRRRNKVREERHWAFLVSKITISKDSAEVEGDFVAWEITQGAGEAYHNASLVLTPVTDRTVIRLRPQWFGEVRWNDVSVGLVYDKLEALFGTRVYRNIPPADLPVNMEGVPPHRRAEIETRLREQFFTSGRTPGSYGAGPGGDPETDVEEEIDLYEGEDGSSFEIDS